MLRKGFSLLFVLLGLTALASAESHARIVRLSYIEGDVELDRRDGRGFQKAFLNMPLIEDARVWTRGDARAEIEFEDGSTLRMVPETIIEFRELTRRGDNDLVTLVDIQEGMLYGNVKRHGGDDFRITFGQEQVTLSKSSRFRLGVSSADTKLAVFRGELEVVRFNGERVEVRKNETFEVSADDRGRTYLARGITEEAHDYWDRQREEDRATYAANEHYNNSRYRYGYYDLNRYGSFFDVAGYGWVWQPFNVGFGWSPFSDGSWVYYPAVGYVWVSPYPWGWTPYRYGSWVYIHNRGWCWRRGNTFNTWYNVTNVHNPPPSFVAVLPPSVHNTNVNVINVGRGGPNVIVRNVDDVNLERQPRGDRGQVVDSRALNGARNDRPTRGVITNENLPAVIGNQGNRANPGTGTGVSIGIRPARTDRGESPDGNRGSSVTSERTRPARPTNDADYSGVDYRPATTTNSNVTVDRPSRTEVREDADRGRVTPAPAANVDRPTRVERETTVIRTDRPQRLEPRPEMTNRPIRSDRMSMPSGAPPSAPPQMSRPSSPPPSAPVQSAPPPPPPAASRESRGDRPR